MRLENGAQMPRKDQAAIKGSTRHGIAEAHDSPYTDPPQELEGSGDLEEARQGRRSATIR